MYIGTQGTFRADHDLKNLAQLGVNHIDTTPDEPLDVNMLKVLKTFKEVGYEYMVMPDHVPAISGPEPRRVGFAYTYGYIHAAMQAVNLDD